MWLYTSHYIYIYIYIYISDYTITINWLDRRAVDNTHYIGSGGRLNY